MVNYRNIKIKFIELQVNSSSATSQYIESFFNKVNEIWVDYVDVLFAKVT